MSRKQTRIGRPCPRKQPRKDSDGFSVRQHLLSDAARQSRVWPTIAWIGNEAHSIALLILSAILIDAGLVRNFVLSQRPTTERGRRTAAHRRIVRGAVAADPRVA
jgi:hypothetical protein